MPFGRSIREAGARNRARRSRPRWLPGLALCAALVGLAGPGRAGIVFTPSGFVEDVVASGLPYATGIAFAPDGRMFIALKDGVVRVVQDGALLPTPFIDLSAQTATAVDRGLLGITVHPDFPDTPYVYLLYTWNPPGYPNEAVGSRAARLIRVEADPAQGYNRALAGSTQPQTVPGGPGHVILVGKNSTLANLANPTWGRDVTVASCMTGFSMTAAPVEDCMASDEDSHTIGTVLFAPDGSLFLGNGDGSNYIGVDPRALRSQLLDSLSGKILRIDPDTGLGLPDNPFYDPACPGCNRSKVYAFGLRNPFRFTLHPVTSEPYIGDVGWNNWEEIDVGKGANFGWPCYEGGTLDGQAVEGGVTESLEQLSYALSNLTDTQCETLYAQGVGAVRAPVFAYSHGGTDGAGTTGGASANAGSFYTGSAYPATYRNALFILDYNRRWIRYLTFDTQGRATVHNFGRETQDGMVQVLTGPDSNLYVVVLNATGGEVRRIRYVAGGNTPPTAVASASPTIGTVPLEVTFSSTGSFDPDAQALSYAWAFGDGDSSAEPDPIHVYDAPGVYTATLTVTELTAPFASRSDDVVITVGNEPPLATILTPPEGTTYAIGDVISYSGSGTAGGDPVDPSQLSWDLRLHHNQHLHFQALPDGVASGSFEVIEHGDDTYYELCLTVTVPPDLTDTRCRALLPRKTDVTLTTDPVGLLVSYDDEGLTQASPFLVHPVVGSVQTASVPAIQGGLTFQSWTGNVTSTSRQFVVGDTPRTFTAQYVNQPPVAVVSADPTSGPAPRQVAFQGSGSSDPELTTLSYQWSFGDGGVSTQANPVHSYATQGTYQAVLTVTDQRGGTDTEGVTIVVGAPSPLCGNGVLNAGEQCDGGGCCTAGCQLRVAGAVCRAAAQACDVAETCSGTSAACPANAFAPNGTSCSDGNVCNGAETCQAGACTAGTALVCNDGNVCTNDACNPTSGCTFTNNAAPCSDGIACTSDVCSGGTCVSTSTCQPDETCVPQTGVCQQIEPVSIWPDTAAPTVFAGADVPSELGVKFRSSVSGYVAGVRFYKSAQNVGPHVGNLWSFDGTRLATATFTNETASGWQEVVFSQPVAIAPETIYVASYHSPTGHYAFSFGQFASQGIDNTPLHVPPGSLSGGNGVFTESPTSAFPTSSYFDTNYWVDVIFYPAAPPGPCADAIDEDGDGFAAFPQDPGCSSATDLDERSAFLPCDNGHDDDGDGTADFGAPAGGPLAPDPGCSSPSAGTEIPACQDGLDNDGQTGIDSDGGASLDRDGNGRIDAAFNPATPLVGAADPQCVGQPARISEAPAATIWPNTAAPTLFAGADVPSELGVKFRSSTSGYITGVRFYKSAQNVGPHVGNLWSLDGTRLATATFTNETASGWQEVVFAQPVPIAPDTTYVASYHAPAGFYGFSFAAFASQGRDAAPLQVPAGSQSGGNGVFTESPTSAFPTSSYFDTNYWVDVVFLPTPLGACANGIDDDGDGLADFPKDPGCASSTDLDERSPFLVCDNGVDDDGDGRIDFGAPAGAPFEPDPGCASPTSSLEKPACQDGLDNDGQPGLDFDGGASLDLDGNGRIDAAFNPATPLVGTADPQCVDKPARNSEAPGCGLGAELAFLLPLLSGLRRRRERGTGSRADRGEPLQPPAKDPSSA